MRQKLDSLYDKNLHTYILLILLSTCSVCSSAYAEVVDRIVAVVNSDVITLSDLEEEIAALSPAIQNAVQNEIDVSDDEIQERALDTLIDLMLIEQKAKDFNVGVSVKEIDDAFEARRIRMSLGPVEFREELLKSGLSEEIFRKRLRASILQSKVISLDVRSKLVVTDEMILEYYQKEYTTNVDEDNYYLLQMGFIWESSAVPETLNENRAEAKKRAERIKKMAQEGQDFKTLAKKFSDLPSASDGGDIGVFSLDEMAESMQNAVENLQPGEISAIIETAAGFQFFKLLTAEEDEEIDRVPLDEVQDEIRKKIGEQKMQESFSTWVKNLKDQAYIQKL